MPYIMFLNSNTLKNTVCKVSLFFVFVFFNANAQEHVLITNQGADEYIEALSAPTPLQESSNKAAKIMACPSSNTLVTGYPAWTNYWAGWMVNINNTGTNTVVINCMEARFDGTSGYRIYNKAGTFVGFEATPGAWTLLGTAAGVVSISTTTSTPIPIALSTTLNPGTVNGFYLTRTDNTVANRHLYISGTGTPGTTIYSSDANLSITEANYIDTYFINMGGTRRPSFQVYYTIIAPLPIELLDFQCKTGEKHIQLQWATAKEVNSDYFSVERSQDGYHFTEIEKVIAAGNSNEKVNYVFTDIEPMNGINYYRLKQFDKNNQSHTMKISSCEFKAKNKKVKVYSLAGQFLTDFNSNNYKSTFSQMEITPGIYLLEINTDEGRVYEKIFKQ